MNVDEILSAAPVTKVSWTDPNVANIIEQHLRGLLPEAFNIDGVWLTGSNVWRFLYGDIPSPDSDIDVMVHDNGMARELLLTATGAVEITGTRPSGHVGGDGTKYRLPNGRTMDVWTATQRSPVEALRTYPEHSHAQCRAAFHAKLGYLVILPNPKAT